MNKDKERARLAAIHFKDAPDCVTHVAMDSDGRFWEYSDAPHIEMDFMWATNSVFDILRKCKHQPATELDWRDTLLRRADYEV